MEEALKIENISVSYGVNEALSGVSFTVYDGDYSDPEIQVMLTRTEDIILA